MKVFFALLLLGNIVFAVVQWLLPYEQLFAQPEKIPTAAELQLLNDANAQEVSEAEVVASVDEETDAIAAAVARIEQEVAAAREMLFSEDDSDKRVCYTVGPIKDKALAIEISGRYSAREAETSMKSSLEKEYLGMMVYIGGHASRAAAIGTANELAGRGITDHIIVDTADEDNVLSLGVFGLKRNAERLKARVASLNYPVETEPRYRERTIYWLYAEQDSETPMLELLDDADHQRGISQIPTQCLPG